MGLKFNLTKNGSLDKSTRLPKGDYRFTFDVVLPSNLPSSFKKKYKNDNVGLICYSIGVVIEREHSEKPIEKWLPFKVENPVNLNEYPLLRRRLVINNKPAKFLCWKSNRSVQFEATLNKGAFVSGDNLVLDLLIKNTTNHIVKDLKLCLLSRTTFDVGKRGQKSFDSILASLDLQLIVYPKTSHDLKNLSLKIPNLICLSFGECKMLKKCYYLIVRNRFNEKTYFTIPILIGSLPFMKNDL